MDPYLEGPLWTSVHMQLSLEIARELAPLLRPRYVVRTPRRFVAIESSAGGEEVTARSASLYPDVGVAEAGIPTPVALKTGEGGGVAVAPLQVHSVMPEVVPSVTIEIRDSADHELVTAIEVLSPVNKRGAGRREYIARRNRFLLSGVHLMEIDLLRTGERVPIVEPLPAYPYFVLLSRGDRRPLTEAWPIGLSDRLPVVPVPLLEGDRDASIDLQRALTSVYDIFAYDLDIDYSVAPEIPLTPAEWEWARAIIEAAKRRE
jgi:hypothetical protein